MDQEVPESRDLPPGDLGAPLSEGLRDLLRRVANDLEVTDHGVLGLGVLAEVLERKAGGVEADLSDRLENVLELDLRIPGHR